jgi:hypothetical protein
MEEAEESAPAAKAGGSSPRRVIASKPREPPTESARVSLEDMVHYYVERILQTRSGRVEYYKSLAVRLRFLSFGCIGTFIDLRFCVRIPSLIARFFAGFPRLIRRLAAVLLGYAPGAGHEVRLPLRAHPIGGTHGRTI